MAKEENGNTRVLFDGETVTARVRDCLLAAQALYRKKSGNAKFRIRLAQGSFSGGSVELSGSTHDGDAVVDVRTRGIGMDPKQIQLLSRCLKQCGAQPFTRDERDGMPPHLHVLFARDAQMADSAKRQVVSYDAGRNGLTNNARDRNSYRTNPKLRYSYTAGKAVPRP